MSKNLRDFLKKYEKAETDHFLNVNKKINCNLEIPEILWKLEKENRFPIVKFNSPLNWHKEQSDFPVVVNIFADRERCAKAISSSLSKIAEDYRKLEKTPIKPKKISTSDAPVKENIIDKKNVDLKEMPIIKHHEHDSGPYITGGVDIIKAPPQHEGWGYNAAFQRHEVCGKNELGVLMLPHRHSDEYYDFYKKSGKDMPISIVIGHHPSFHLGSQTLKPIDTDEYETIGGVMKAPLDITPSETWGDEFWIPANAEIVIEGVVKREKRIDEGPLGEYTGYYGPEKSDRKLIKVKAINHRNDAIYHDVFAGHKDHHLVGGIPIEARIFDKLSDGTPNVTNVHLPPSGNSRLHCYISIDKNKEGEGKNAILSALSTYELIKHVIVVDDDIDIFNEREVLWAISTRTQLGKDLVLIEDCKSETLDPSAKNYEMSDRGGIDATIAVSKDYPEKLEPAEIDLDESYLS